MLCSYFYFSSSLLKVIKAAAVDQLTPVEDLPLEQGLAPNLWGLSSKVIKPEKQMSNSVRVGIIDRRDCLNSNSNHCCGILLNGQFCSLSLRYRYASTY
jgi:hypothetical protein